MPFRFQKKKDLVALPVKTTSTMYYGDICCVSSCFLTTIMNTPTVILSNALTTILQHYKCD